MTEYESHQHIYIDKSKVRMKMHRFQHRKYFTRKWIPDNLERSVMQPVRLGQSLFIAGVLSLAFGQGENLLANSDFEDDLSEENWYCLEDNCILGQMESPYTGRYAAHVHSR